MAHRIYNLDASYWRISGGSLTTSGLFSSNTDAYVLSGGLMYQNSQTKDSTLTLAGLQQYRRTLGSGFTLSAAELYQLPSWEQVGFGSNFSDIRDNYDLFIERHIESLSLQLNPANLDFATLLVMGTIPGAVGSDQYFIPIMIFSSQGTALNVVDSTSPTVGTGITFNNVQLTSIQVNWGAASDAITPQASLQYKVVRADSTGLLDTVSNAQSNGITVMDWTANTTTYTNAVLIPNTTYAYAVLVRDSSNNIALYTAQSQSTLADSTSPTVGTALQYSSVTSSGASLTWGAATDNYNTQASLEYQVVYSTSDNIGTVSNANSNGTVAMSWSANTLSYNATGLTDGTTYYFAVLVRDSAGNTALYSPVNFQTLASLGYTELTVQNTSTLEFYSDGAYIPDNTPIRVSVSGVTGSPTSYVFRTNGLDSYGAQPEDNINLNFDGSGPLTLTFGCKLIKGASEYIGPTKTINFEVVADTTAPTVGTGIQFANTTDTTMDVSWGAATDDITTQANLEYKLVSSSTNNLTSVADAESYGSLWMDWTANRLDYPILGATPSTLYYFAVIVRDEAGNKALYTQQSNSTTATPDTMAPTPGNAGAITFSSISENSVTVEWTAATDDVSSQANLEYLVAKNSTSQYLANYGDLISIHPNLIVQSWTSNITSYVDNSVSVGDNPSYIVYVKDEAGNVAGYLLNSVQIPDQTAPSFGSGQMYFNNVTYTSMDLSWDAATDNYDSHPSISYKVLISSSNNISTVSDAELNGTMLMDWTANVLYSSASFLSINTTYYFAVLAKDMAGNKTILLGSQATAADTTAPVPGMSGVISVTSFTDTTIDISWSPASEDYSSPSYKIVYSTSDNLNTVANAEANGTLVLDWIPMTTSVSISSLSPDTLYYFQVLVKDEAGNKAIYSGGSQQTSA